MKTNKSLLIVGTVVVVLLAGGAWMFHRQKQKAEGHAQIEALSVDLAKAKESVLKDYDARLNLVIAWEKELRGEVKLNDSQKINQTILQSNKLDFDTQEAATRFDFVQNQVSELISSYIKLKPTAPQLKEIQKVEESLNRDRKAYHEIAFKIEDLDRTYRLHEAKPVIFQAERELKKYEQSKTE